MTGDDRRELELWRQVFGPATLAQLEHLAGSLHCNCNPVCGHEEEYCAEYDRLGPAVFLATPDADVIPLEEGQP